MRSVQVVEAKAKFSALLAAVEAGETVAILRRGRVVARLVPDSPCVAADAFRALWADQDDIDLVMSADRPPEPVEPL
ncbi:MAG: type II toxin-antitoxin system prevent-host-death family antitoxin [Lamprocystis purpurea]|jgi:prevent-host-death family protein|uniref:type II toxin-antitoxin system Phd/YefM family antitoxin n=1 Tax=Lamprocystis purpurea TaxID=61598 RepID=UPI0003645316|nr:type II toxin-antitoxin system prevent-host-death family antitoxin [Lamprocystis purpurea]MBV5274626.1 type II toxin-antitoxin system prevent-host-death family antitoxin [Lamprocystis purpurea]